MFTKKRLGLRGLICGAALLGLLAISPSPASADTYVPAGFGDVSAGPGACFPDPCTLRDAVLWANTNAGDDDIRLREGTYMLTQWTHEEVIDSADTGDLDVTPWVASWDNKSYPQMLTITGAGAGKTIIDAGEIDRALDIKAGAVLRVRGVSIRRGHARFDPDTGHSHGGGIHNHGFLLLESSALAGNIASAQGSGGGGLTNAGWALLRNVTVASNVSRRAPGAGIENKGTLFLEHVTVADNHGERAGQETPGVQGGGIAGPAWLRSTIVAKNLGGDCSQQIQSGGHNLDGDGTCGLDTAQNDQPNVDPKFAFVPLTDNAGYGYIYPLRWGSKAIDKGSPSHCLPTDEIGTPRPIDGDGSSTAECDIGAYEAVFLSVASSDNESTAYYP
jgi:hypothetical protein